MKIALAAVGFKNNNLAYNKEKIIELIKIYSKSADMILFGESFLQGFDCLVWNYEKDSLTAVEQKDPIMKEISTACKENCIAVSFGYIEKNIKGLYSSQIVFSKDGTILDNYNRISIGWKEEKSDFHYLEGDEFHTFEFENKTFATALCGDLWYDENVDMMRNLEKDIVLWPVYTDFASFDWNNSDKYDYCKQALKCGKNVLYVNSVNLSCNDEETAKGGAAYFYNGQIKCEIPSGEEGVLVVEI